MAKKRGNRTQNHTKPAQDALGSDHKSGNSLKELLGENALGKLKQMEKDLKEGKERQAREEAEKRRKELEEREKNKSFGELLQDYEKKGGGKYS
ncbi:YqkE family protein [Brevibacterium sp. JNUCC-42]|uniref:DUF3886 domain-containing protein n=1 Tax=Brevibacillus laterosporus TaxID=1465 RepID=A0A502J0X4_BRELA|nr:YqkE family protein [Brevibacillus laterosporus]QOS99008.1 YqkE family protein [Brevibacterium sp. JNUCC-42]QDX92570.1 DUF3886 domain-containing protein [Brevibacillus laterosporus]RAP27906.1 hypothetical protein C2W64_00725 [Brevibacillus laterosporus]TPG70879.1 DUF3886 domain-containing protein [Brevibacillus laterosporus]TPG91684.1 DUF3886 domain-containing protein [Brevibacillus laterosporus]